MSDLDPKEAYTAVKLVVLISRQAVEEAKENPKVAELKDRVLKPIRGCLVELPTRPLRIAENLVRPRLG